jgi:PTH1 family peptidyl-tRNA hydrolase
MIDKVQLIVGLGNPGLEYQHTRHNAGFQFVEALAQHYNIPLNLEKKFHGLLGKGVIDQQPVWLLLPTTYMNKSGLSVRALSQFYQIEPENIFVAHDELDIPAGSIKLKLGGGHGGQNGLRDIISQLGNNNKFYRLRIGIGHPGDKSKVTGHVLGKPSQTEKNNIDDALNEVFHCIPDIIKGDWSKAMNRLHSLKA